MAQFARPDSTVSANNWTFFTSSIHEDTNEVTPNDDTDYAIGVDTLACTVTISDVTDPEVSTGHILRWRAKAVGSGQGESAFMQLRQGGALKAGIPTETIDRSDYETVTYTLSEAEADSITDYTDLTFSYDILNIGGGESIRVTWAEFEVPDAPGAPTDVFFENKHPIVEGMKPNTAAGMGGILIE